MTAPRPVIEAVQRVEAGYSAHLPGRVVVSGARSHRGRILSWQDPRTITRPGSQELATFDAPEPDWGLPAIKKRTWQQRIESLTNRLVDARSQTGILDPVVMEALTGEYWKAGVPVRRDQLEEVAKRLLAQADRKQRLSLIPDVATGAWSPPKPAAKTRGRRGW